MTINERIRHFRKDVLNMNQRQFAAALGMAQTGVSGTERDGATVTDRFIKSVCLAYNLNESWLRDGSEPMYIQPPTFSLDKFIKDREGTDQEIEIIKTYFELDPEIRKAVFSHFKEKFTPSTHNDLFEGVPMTSAELEQEYPPLKTPNRNEEAG